MKGTKELFEKALAAEGVTGRLADVARSIYHQESGSGANTKTSSAGARGGMQILPGTFAEVADKGWSIDNTMDNARGGIRYLKMLDQKSGGDPALTAAGYYGGPGGMEKARRGIAVSDPRNPNAPNTLEYGQQVVARLPAGKTGAPPVVAATQPEQVVPAQQTAVVPQVVEPEVRIQAPQLQAGANAWQEFLQSMPKEQAPVSVADLSFAKQFGAPAPVNVDFQPPARAQLASLVPNFAAFSRWTPKHA